MIRTTFWTRHSHQVRPDDEEGAERVHALLDVGQVHETELEELHHNGIAEDGKNDLEAKSKKLLIVKISTDIFNGNCLSPISLQKQEQWSVLIGSLWAKNNLMTTIAVFCVLFRLNKTGYISLQWVVDEGLLVIQLSGGHCSY